MTGVALKRLLAPIVIGLLGAAILVALGVWQVQRLHWKEAILAEIDATIAGEAQPLPQLISPADQRYMPVELEGRFGDGALYVLVSTQGDGPGWRVISDFTTEDGRRVLVDRGFTPVAQKDATRPDPKATIDGNLHWPDDRTSATPANDPVGNIWYARDIADMADRLDTEPLLVVARSIDPADPGIRPMPVDSSGIRNDHLQYAGTWFSLAAAWLLMTGVWIRHRLQGKD